MKTVITYKKNEKWIFDEIEKHSGKGNWVKDVLANYLQGKLVYAENIQQSQQINNNCINTNKKNRKSIDMSEFGNIFDKEK